MSLDFFGIAGSLRRKSINQGLLRAVFTRLPAGVEMDLADLTDIPFYNTDIMDKPVSVVRVFEQIGCINVLALAYSEYNHSLVPVLKNILDWASHEPNNVLLVDKPVATLDVGSGMGTSCVRHHLRQVCVYLDLHPLSKPEMFTNAFAGGFITDGDLTDEYIAGLITEQMQALVNWMSKHKARKKPCLR